MAREVQGLKPYAVLIGAIGGWYSGFAFRTDAEKVLMFACFVAVVADWITGLAASYKIGKAISSARMREGFAKLIGYFGLVLISVATAQFLKSSGVELPQVPILTGSLGLIFATEALSVVENVTKLTGIKLLILRRILEGIREPEPDAKPAKRSK